MEFRFSNSRLEDLFVGAPFYGREEARDCGRVYVYMNTKVENQKFYL